MASISQDSQLNLKWWDERAALHGEDRVYNLDRFTTEPTASTLKKQELLAVGDVSGQNLIHLQCHLGVDTLSWLRAGAATVTGLDFSQVAVDKARLMAERMGYASRATFIQANVLELPTQLHQGFDVVFANIGTMRWIGDLTAWMRSAFSVLVPGGRLAFHEMHPLYSMAASVDPLVLDRPYLNQGPLLQRNNAGSYAVPDAVTQHDETLLWAHSLGEVVTAAIHAGFVIERLTEHFEAEYDGRWLLPRDPDGLFRWRSSQGALLPFMFTLVARKAR